MKRLVAGAALVVAVLTGCSSQPDTGAIPHIVALAVQPTEAPPPNPIAIQPAAPAVAERRAVVVRASRSSAPRTAVVGGDVWAALARCESGGNPRAVGGGGRYYGAFQFSLSTWHSLGMSGNPVDASYATQADAARRLQARSGWGQWPRCARRLGLR